MDTYTLIYSTYRLKNSIYIYIYTPYRLGDTHIYVYIHLCQDLISNIYNIDICIHLAYIPQLIYSMIDYIYYIICKYHYIPHLLYIYHMHCTYCTYVRISTPSIYTFWTHRHRRASTSTVPPLHGASSEGGTSSRPPQLPPWRLCWKTRVGACGGSRDRGSYTGKH